MRRWLLGAVGLSFLIGGVWVGRTIWLISVPVGRRGTVTVSVRRGDTFSDLVAALERKGLLRSRRWFESLALRRGLTQRLKAGIYEIPTPISLLQLLHFLDRSVPRLIRLTVWEGMMAKEIGERIERLGLGRADEFIGIVQSPKGRVNVPFPWDGDLEGILFPDTYLVPPLRPGDEAFLVQLMVNTFAERFWKPYRDEIEQNPLSLREVVILASLVQWEVKVDEERPIVAGVLLNRLRKGMRLEVDATVLYALGQRKERVLYRDLRVNSPYNTYRHKGFPPGPICNPGLPSLLAALRPAKVPYLFYVARGDGRHTFSRTYREHLRAVRAYRAWRRQKKLSER